MIAILAMIAVIAMIAIIAIIAVIAVIAVIAMFAIAIIAKKHKSTRCPTTISNPNRDPNMFMKSKSFLAVMVGDVFAFKNGLLCLIVNNQKQTPTPTYRPIPHPNHNRKHIY